MNRIPKNFQSEMSLKMVEQDLTISRLSDKSQIPEQWLRAYLNGVGVKQMPTWHAKGISDALGWSIDDMCELIFKKGGAECQNEMHHD